MDESLIGHWKFEGDCRDYSGKENHGLEHRVDFSAAGRSGKPGTAARFNGRDACIRVRHNESLQLGTAPFTAAVWVRTDPDLDDVIGDIIHKYDDKARKGLNLWIAGTSGGYNSHGDAKHLHFGIDDGVETPWVDCGKLERANTYVAPLTVFDGNLYAGIAETLDPKKNCRVLRYAGGQKWADCGRAGKDMLVTSAYSFIVHKGELYCGTGYQDWTKVNRQTCGFARVYKYAGGKKWIDCGQPGENHRVLSLASYKGEIYCGTDGDPAHGPLTGKVFKYAGKKKWIDCGRLGDQSNVFSLVVHDGHLYGGTGGEVYRYEGGDEWAYIGQPCGNTQVHSLQVYKGKLWAGTWPQGYICRYEGGMEWTNCGTVGRVVRTSGRKLGPLNEVNDLTVYNGKLYAGVIPKGEVYRYENGDEWTMVRRLVTDPNYHPQSLPSWSRVPCLTVFDGRLYAGTGSCRGYAMENPHDEYGRIYSTSVGQVVSHNKDLGSGWRHIAAVRDDGALKLYVDGQLVSASQPFTKDIYDLANREHLFIGFGAVDFFSGDMADLRLYSRALPENEIQTLSKAEGE